MMVCPRKRGILEMSQFKNFPEFLSHCKEYGSKISVRCIIKGTNSAIDGKWQNIEFSLLTPRQQLEIAKGWYDCGHTPVRVK